jgi:hypothetical protein
MKVGTYSVSVSWSYPGHATGSASGCGDTAKAAYAPYFAVAGGDVSAGPGFETPTGCSPDTTAIIKGWNMGSTGSFAGAGTTLGAFALGNIIGFATGQGGVSGAPASPGAPSQLAFANTTATGKDAGDTCGGTLGLNSCVPDYQAAALVDANKTESSTSFDLTGKDSGIYKYTGGGTLSVRGTVGAGKHITLVVDKHDVYVSDILYDNYSGIDQIPQFQLLVKGNIYIKNDTETLRGFYDAQPDSDGNGGAIHTCATYFLGIVLTPSTDYGTCNHPLTIYGAVAAKKIYLERSYGNVAAVPASGILAAPAEKVVFTPELWMTAAQPPTTGFGLDDWQAATSLPPIL